MKREIFVKNLKRFTMILVAILPSIVEANHVGNPLYSDISEEEVFQLWRNKEYVYEDTYQERDRFIAWIDEFSKDEKSGLLAYIDNEEKIFTITRRSVVAKALLGRSDKFAYVTNLDVKDPKPSYYGQVVCLVEIKDSKYTITPLSSPIHLDTGIRLKFHFVDIEGDRLKEIIEERKLEGNPENYTARNFVSAIYKNNNMKFSEIYREQNYDFLKFKDIDNDGRLEILETVNELSYEMISQYYKWQWINIYQWDGMRLEKANDRFLSFYLEREKLYRSLLQEASAEVAENRKLGRTNLWDDTERALKTYIDRIEEMKKSGEQKSK